MDSNERRLAVSDEGKNFLRGAHLYFTTLHTPVGNINFPTILLGIKWGWVGQNGLTKAGYQALRAGGYKPLGQTSVSTGADTDTSPSGGGAGD